MLALGFILEKGLDKELCNKSNCVWKNPTIQR